MQYVQGKALYVCLVPSSLGYRRMVIVVMMMDMATDSEL